MRKWAGVLTPEVRWSIAVVIAVAGVLGGIAFAIWIVLRLNSNAHVEIHYIHDSICILYSNFHRACPLPPVP